MDEMPFCVGTAVNFVGRAGSGPQFAGATGTGTQMASAVSQPGLTPTGLGVSNPGAFLVGLPTCCLYFCRSDFCIGRPSLSRSQ